MMTKVLALATALIALPLQAQQPEPVRRGLLLGFDPLTYASLESDAITGGRNVGGSGISVRVGWGFNATWSVVMDVAVTDLNVADTAQYLLSHGDLLVRATPVAWGTPLGVLVPVLQGGFSLRDVTAEGASPTNTAIYAFEGGALTLGVGAELYLRPTLALWLAASWAEGEFDDERIGNTTTHNRNATGSSMRVGLGLTWHRRPRRP